MALMLVFLSLLVKYTICQPRIGSMKLSTCSIGDVSENDLVRCICSSKNIYNCILKDKSKAIVKDGIKLQAKPARLNETLCQPNMAYEQETIACICNKNGTWPHKKCAQVLKSLPVKTIVKKVCKPNTYVTVNCNVCRCDPEGRIDEHHCTKNDCRADSRRTNENKKMYGDCECGNWYSLAPCQFCYCVNSNKLVCNTGTSKMTNDVYLQLGAYNLHICGKGLTSELRDLERNNRGVLRQSDVIKPHIKLSSSKPSTLPKPSINPLVADETINAPDKKENNFNKNIVDDNSFKDSDDSKEQETKELEIKSDALIFKQSTKLPYDDKDDNEPVSQSEEQIVVNNFQGNIDENEDSHKDIMENTRDQDEIHYKYQIGRQKKIEEDNLGQLAESSGEYREHYVPRQDYYQKLLKQESNNEETTSVSNEMQIPVSNKITASDALNVARQKKLNNKNEHLLLNVKVDLPSVLSKVLNLALRKSMVTIKPGQDCTPGTMEVMKCNTCFCLKNGKLLCTMKECATDDGDNNNDDFNVKEK